MDGVLKKGSKIILRLWKIWIWRSVVLLFWLLGITVGCSQWKVKRLRKSYNGHWKTQVRQQQQKQQQLGKLQEKKQVIVMFLTPWRGSFCWNSLWWNVLNSRRNVFVKKVSYLSWWYLTNEENRKMQKMKEVKRE